jgi:ribosomal-protein-alanine N-acetyltransferase
LADSKRFSPTRACSLNRGLRTLRLTIEPLLASHAEAMFEPMQAAALYSWISAEPPTSMAALAARWQRNESRLAPDGSAAWLGWAVLAGDEIIGKLDAEITTGEIASNVGYLVFVDHWGKGFASEAVRALSDHLAGAGIREQHATVTVGNHASCRVLEKCGFEQRGVLPANDVIRGVACDDYAYVRRS